MIECNKIKLFKNGEINLYTMFLYIFKKYIEANVAYFEINIDSITRKRICNFILNKYSNENTTGGGKWEDMIKKLLPLFDRCLYESSNLLQDCYGRFKRTKEFETILNQWNANDTNDTNDTNDANDANGNGNGIDGDNDAGGDASGGVSVRVASNTESKAMKEIQREQE